MSSNGTLTRAELAPIWNGMLLRKDAALAFNAMDSQSVKAHGRHIGVSDAYRPLGHPGDNSRGMWSQWAAWERMMAGGNLAAHPGTSNHGEGIATDNTSDGTVLIRLDDNRHGWDHSHSDAPSEWWHHKWDGHGAPKPKPDPLRHLPKHMREAAALLLYRRRMRAHEGRTGQGRKWRRWDRAVTRSYKHVEKLHRRAENGNFKHLLKRVLNDRNGRI